MNEHLRERFPEAAVLTPFTRTHLPLYPDFEFDALARKRTAPYVRTGRTGGVGVQI